jgi:hypothetical protein
MNSFFKKIFFRLVFLVNFTFYIQSDLNVLVSHGYGDMPSNAAIWMDTMIPILFEQENWIMRPPYLRSDKIIIPDFEDKPNGLSHLNKTYLGQGEDILKLQKEVENKIQKNDFVAVGHSRGSAALISYLGQYNPSNLKMLVLNAAPTSFPAVIADRIGGWNGSIFCAKIFLNILTQYPWNDLQPINAISKIKNKDLPVVIMHAENDDVISYYHGCLLYDEFRKNGFKNVYWISKNSGGHNQSLTVEAMRDLFSIYNYHSLLDYRVYQYKMNLYFGLNALDLWSYEELKIKFQPNVPLYQAPIMFRKQNVVPLVMMVAVFYSLYKNM